MNKMFIEKETPRIGKVEELHLKRKIIVQNDERETKKVCN